MLLFSFLSEPLLHPPSRRRPCSVGCRPSLRLAFARTCPTHAYSHTHHCYPRTFDMHHHKTPSLDHAHAQDHWKTYGPSLRYVRDIRPHLLHSRSLLLLYSVSFDTGVPYGPSLSSVGSKNALGTWIHRRRTTVTGFRPMDHPSAL